MSRPRTKGELGLILESRTIRSKPKIKPVPEINFSWTPQLIAYTLQINGNIYPWQGNQPVAGSPNQSAINRTAAQQELTFTANVRLPDNDFITEYEWDFGDGVRGNGASVTHTYTTPAPSTRARLCITDNHNRRFCIGKPLNLYAADLVVVGGLPLVNP